MARTLAGILGISGVISSSRAFSPTANTNLGHSRQRHQREAVVLQSIFYDDFEGFSDFSLNQNSPDTESNNNNNEATPSLSDTDIFASLRARQDSLKEEQQRIEEQTEKAVEVDLIERERLNYNWNEANCVSTVRLTIDDWIRRMAVDLYPMVVCGSSRGNLYLGNLDDGDQLDCLEGVHSEEIHEDIPDDVAQACIQALYDGYDGNGPFAIAMKKDLVVSSGREGGIYACTIIGEEVDVASGSRGGSVRQTKLRLQREGKFRGLEGGTDSNGKSIPPPLITSLVFDNRGTLWAGGYDGKLRGYNHEEFDLDDRPLMLRQKAPDFDIDVGAPILDMNVEEETGIIVVTTHTKGVFLYSLHDGRFLFHCNPFAPSKLRQNASISQRQFARTAMAVLTNNSTTALNESDSDAVLIIGGSYGHMYQIQLSIATDEKNPSRTLLVTSEGTTKITPKHMGPVVCLESPSPGLFVSASHDGTMRVWDCSGRAEDDDDDNDIDDDDETRAVAEESKGPKPKMPKVLYALSGYKVWLGSVFANERKLVSDGADNTVIVHSFDEDEDAILRSQQEDDEDNNLDDDFSSLA
ncbi:unnamed protein product [Pseudo-nitzschia multistriata]|uniref:Uncharacterized protein n=1 Tax=Pseudo-nitzschia multistriata TaxID=183589 RepID=A0A448Z9L0_9STRA|nr:unnamed protein product [Pseudo-nitzschia multistriata]